MLWWKFYSLHVKVVVFTKLNLWMLVMVLMREYIVECRVSNMRSLCKLWNMFTQLNIYIKIRGIVRLSIKQQSTRKKNKNVNTKGILTVNRNRIVSNNKCPGLSSWGAKKNKEKTNMTNSGQRQPMNYIFLAYHEKTWRTWC